MARRLNRLIRQRRGNVAMVAAGALPLLAGSLALAVDYGRLTLDRRALQQEADLAAIVVAAHPGDRIAAVRDFIAANGLDHVIAIDGHFIDAAGVTHDGAPADAGILTIEPGRYSAAADRAVNERFEPLDAGTNANAARVTIRAPGTLHFAALFADPPTLSATGTAHMRELAAFSIGSRLARLEGGVLNAVLGSLLGGEIALTAMDYDALIEADVSLLSFMEALATELDLTAVTYDELLAREVTIGRLTAALANMQGLDAGASDALRAIAADALTTDTPVALSAFFDAGPLSSAMVGAEAGIEVAASAFDILSAAAAIAGGGRQVALDLDVGLPGIAELDLKLSIGEPPADSAWVAVGERGATVRTAQTRLKLDVRLLGSGAVSAISVPLYLEIAYGEATLASIECAAGGRARGVTLDARPGVLEAAIGNVKPAAFRNFAREPVVSPATLVDLMLLKVKGSAHLEVANVEAQAVRFDATDIADGTVRRIATRDLTRSLTLSLLERLRLDVDLVGLGLGLGGTAAVTALVSDILEGAAAPLDDVIHNVLLALGVTVGEADLRVTGAECGRAVLVQ